MKEFKVIPFQPIHGKKGQASLKEVANKLEDYIHEALDHGWDYEGIETITSHVPAKGGCFGIGRQQAYDMSNHFIVLSRESLEE